MVPTTMRKTRVLLLVQAIKDAKKRSVAVRIISDKIQSAGKAQSEALKILGSASIPIKINSHSGLMYLKVAVADRKIATIGSFNYSKAASTTNDELIMVVHDEKVAKSFGDQFEAMWNDNKGFKTITPKIAQPAGNNPVPAPTGKPASNSNVTYQNCAAVKAAGKAPSIKAILDTVRSLIEMAMAWHVNNDIKSKIPVI